MANSLQLQIAEQGNNTIKLAWSRSDVFSRIYCVNRARLVVATTAVREILESIAEDYRADDASYTSYLPALARAGEDLREAIFDPSEYGSTTDDLFDYLNTQPTPTLLTIFSDASVQIPWNFVYACDARNLRPATGTLADFDDFWLSRFRIRIRYNQTSLPPSRPIQRNGVRTLLALHTSRFRAAVSALQSHADVYPDISEKIARLLAYQVGEAANWDECRQKWDTIAQNDSILYIFAHSDGEKLYLEDCPKFEQTDAYKYELDTNGFTKIFKKKPQVASSSTLCFINGCRTAAGDWGNGFLAITSGRGFHGFIGSEAEIANTWATRYAIEFLHALLEEGKSVGEAYDQTRERCFPMSLWYSCYAYPEFRIAEEQTQ